MKKIAGLILALIMLVSMLPAALAENTAEEQVVTAGGTVYYDVNGHEASSTFPGGDAVVKMSKTVAPTGVENEFEVTLQVSTTQDIRTLRSETPDAAVMLILDVSNSMDDCDHCGLEADDVAHTGTTYRKCPGMNSSFESRGGGGGNRNICRNCGEHRDEHTNVTTDPTCTYVARLARAKAAAIQFLDDFANDTGVQDDDARYVSIVDFGSMAARRQNWIDVTNPAQLAAAKAVINNLTVAHSGTDYSSSDDGGTNIEAALMLGANLWNANQTVKAIDYKYTILLTDGNPTYYVSDNENSRNSSTAVYGTKGGSSVTNLSDAKDVGTQAKRILDLGSQSKLFSICYGTVNGTKVWETKPFKNWDNANPRTTENTTVGQWLEAFSTAAFDGVAEDLFETFNSIISQIQLAAQAWKVEDTMGPYAVWGGEVPQSWNNKHNVIGNTLHWDVLSSVSSSTTSETVGQTRYVVLNYDFKYKVTLDNLNESYVAGAETKTNAGADLDYAVLDETTDLWEVVENVEFPEPTVKGYSGTLSFEKGYLVDDQFVPRDGVEFTLVPKNASKTGTTWQATAVSDNGRVVFENIPSGHEYWLYEMNLDDDFVDPGQIPVSVSWGVADCDALTEEGRLINETSEKNVSLTLKKAFGTDEHPDSVTFQISNAEIGYASEVTLNDDNDWTAEFHGLQPGKYIISESAELESYEVTSSATLNGESQTVSNNRIQAVLQAGESSHKSYEVVFTNSYTRQTGNVSLNKVFLERDRDELVSGSDQITMLPMDEAMYKDLSVTIRLTDDRGNVYEGVLNSENHWSADMSGVPVGVYTITEVVSPTIADHDFIHLHMLVDGTERPDGKIEVGKDAQITVGLENHYTHHVGDIRVVKTLLGVDEADLEDHVFTVGVYSDEACTDLVTTIEVRRLGSGTWSGTSVDIPVGNYYLNEIGGIDLPFYNAVSQEFDNRMVTVTNGTSTSVPTVTAQLVNTYEEKLGELTVVKEFVYPEAYEDEFEAKKPQTINIQVKDAFGTVVDTLQLTSGNGYKASTQLPMGQYYLSEIVAANAEGSADIEGFGVSEHWTDNATVSFANDNETKTLTVTNTYTKEFGSLTISKRFEGIDEEDTALLDQIKPIFLIYDAEGELVATVNLPDQQSGTGATVWTKTISLPTGSYRLLERNVRDALQADHYTFTGLTINNEPVDLTAGYAFAISEYGEVELNAVNTYAKDKANLTVRKEFHNDSQLQADDFETIDIQLVKDGKVIATAGLNSDNDWSYTFEKLEAGVSYTLVEVTAEDAENTAYRQDYTLTSSWSNNATILLTKEGADNTVTNTYTKKEASFAVRKFFEGIQSGDADALNDVRIVVEVRDKAEAEAGELRKTIELTRSNNWSSGDIVLPVGTYTLTEKAIKVPGYDHADVDMASQLHPDRVQLLPDGRATIQLVADQQDVLRIQVTNTMKKRVGTLEITKAFSINDEEAFTYPNAIDVLVKKADGSVYQTVTLKADDNGEWKAKLENVPEGTYQVEEVTASGATNTAFVENFGLQVTYDNSGAVTVTNGQDAEMQITNHYTRHMGLLTIAKAFNGVDEEDIPQDLEVRIKAVPANTVDPTVEFVLTADNDWTLSQSVAVGTYTFTEEMPEIANYTASSYYFTPEQVLVTSNATAEVVATNVYTKMPGSLKLTKVLRGDETLFPRSISFVIEGQSVEYQKTVELTAAQDWTVTVEGMPAGDYIVRETVTAGNGYKLTTEWSAEDGKVTILPNQTAELTCTNTYDPKLSVRIPVEKTVQLGSTMSPVESTFSFVTQWQGSEGVSVRFENDALNTHGMLRRAGQNRYEMTVLGAGTVRGYIVLEGYASDLVGFRLKTRELLTGYDDAIAALAAGWTFDSTATDGVSMWNVELASDGKGKVVTRIQKTGEQPTDRIAFVNVFTKDAPLPPPQTGDNASLILWMALCVLSGFGLVAGLKKRTVSRKD